MRNSKRSGIASGTAPEPTENEIQRSVFDHFRVRAAPGVFAFHPKNASSDMRGRRRGVYAGLGVVPGIPDVIAFKMFDDKYDGMRVTLYGLELKRLSRRGKPATEHESVQLECRNRMAKCGAITGVAYGIDEALEWFEFHGLLQGTAS